jgi:excisionase family DNA binding protein
VSLKSAIQALVAAAPGDAVVPVRWLGELLADDGQGATTAATKDVVAIDLTVPQLAERFGRGPSTIRTWCENGQLPGAYRLNGREWRIPTSAVEAMQKEAAKRPSPRTMPQTKRRRVSDIGEWRQHLTPKAS